MRVLVTGHDGYIGTVLLPLLQRAGHDVVGLDTGLFSECRFGQEDPCIESLYQDVRDVTVEDLRGFYAIVHLAAISNDPLADLDPRRAFAVNHLASVHLARCAKQARVPRFVYASSCGVYGPSSADDLLSEEAPFRAVTPYAASKARAEEGIGRLADDGFCPTFLRISTPYGVSPRLRGDLVVNDLVPRALASGAVWIEGDGKPWCALVHVEDVSRAFLSVLEAPWERVHNQAFNVGRSQENYRIRDLADLVQEIVEGSYVRYAAAGDLAEHGCRVDCRKIETGLPGYRPRWTVRDGIEQLCRAYRDAGLKREDLERSRYLRSKHILALIDAGRLDADLRWSSDQGGQERRRARARKASVVTPF